MFDVDESKITTSTNDGANDGQSGVVGSTKRDSVSKVDNDDVSDWDTSEDEDAEDEDVDVDDGDDESQDDDDIGSKDEETAEPQSKMTPEENKAYQKIRQKAEAEARASLEKDKQTLAEQQRNFQAQLQVMKEKEIENKYLASITDEKIEALAYEKGYSVDSAREILLRDARISATLEINHQKQQNEINRLKKDSLKNDKYFKHIEPQIDILIQQDPNLDINGAYNYLLGEYLRSGKMDTYIQTEKRNTQQKTIADIQDRNRRRSIPSSASGKSADEVLDAKSILDPVSMKMASVFGHDPKDIAKYVKKNLKKR